MRALLYFGAKMNSFAWVGSVFYYDLCGILHVMIRASVRYVKTALYVTTMFLCSYILHVCSALQLPKDIYEIRLNKNHVLFAGENNSDAGGRAV